MDLITAGLGFVLAYVIGLTGVGGGALVAPALFVIVDLPYADAVGTSLVYALLTKILSAAQHIRQGTVQWRLALLFGLWGIPGAVAGSYLLHGVGSELERVFPLLMGGLLLLVAGLLAGEASGLPRFRRARALSPEKLSALGWLGIGAYALAVGALMGVTSVGSGSLIILCMVYLFDLSARTVVGTNIVLALMMVLPAAATHLGLGGVNLRVLGFLLIGSLAGAVLGSRTTIWIPDRVLRFAIVLFIAVSAIATFGKVGWAS
ncbi:MAG: sulfite exporter TauE/SafE family protein [Anaerolineae bacterium]